MRAFAHPPSLDIGHVDINEAVRNTLIVATNEYKYVADITTDLGDLPLVECNAADINQMLINLIVNSAHAIADHVAESGKRGSIDIRTRFAHVRFPARRGHHVLRAASGARGGDARSRHRGGIVGG